MKLLKYYLSVFVIILIVFAIKYISNINLAGSFNVININDSIKITAITPLGREVEKSNDFIGFYKEIRIEGTDEVPMIIQKLNDIETTVSLKKTNDIYVSDYGALSFYQKFKVIIIISLRHIMFFILILLFLYFIIANTFQYIKKGKTKFLLNKINKLKAVFNIIKNEQYKLLFPIILGFIPGYIFLLLKPGLPIFLDASFITVFFVFGIIFSPQLFLIFYSKKLKINFYFWLSFLIIFIIYYFILCPDYYIYGKLFRDDISKFFTKANTSNLFEALTSVNANYLNTYQTITAHLILRIMGIKNYFPELFQLTVLLSILTIYASFNLKVFRTVCSDDKLRFVISILCAFIGSFSGFILFLYDVPFLAALLFWVLLFIKIENISITYKLLILIVFIIFILSKPIYLIYLPILLFLAIYALYFKKKHTLIISLIWITALIFHFFIFTNPDNVILSQHTVDGLGVEQKSDFRYDNLSVSSIAEAGLFVYTRLLVRIIFPFEMGSSIWQMIINIFLFVFNTFLIIWLIYKYLKYKKIEYLFLFTGNTIAFFVVLVFVKAASIDLLFESGKNILNYHTKDFLFSGYIPPAHRYLILAYVPLLASVLFFFISLIQKKTGISVLLLIIFFGIYYISISVFYYRNVIFSENKIQYKYSLWRQYSDMIYDYPNNYYLPYYDYPKQNESIKSGVNRITDVYVTDSGVVKLLDVHRHAYQWKIIQIITEYEPDICPNIQRLVCVTNDRDTLSFKSIKPLNETYRFIIFRFDDFLKLKEFKFVDKNNSPLKLKNLIRLIGTYE